MVRDRRDPSLGNWLLRPLLAALALCAFEAPQAVAQTPAAAAVPVRPLALRPPVAPRHPAQSVHHGIVRVDDYAWLRDPGWREVLRDGARLAPEIRSYIDAENDYATAALSPLAPLRAKIVDELKGRVEQADSTVPIPDGPYAYWKKYAPGAEHYQVVRAPRDGGAEQVVLDGPALAAGKSYFSIGAYDQSPDHRLFAYTVDETGNEDLGLRIRDMANGVDLPYTIPAVSDFAWMQDGRTLLYVRRDSEQRPRLVYRHHVGDNPDADVLIYEEPDPGVELAVNRSRSGRFVIISARTYDFSEAWLVDATQPEAWPTVVEPRQPNLRYAVDDWGDDLVIRTNADGAADFKLVTAPAARPWRANWRDLVPAQDGRLIENFVVFANHVARIEIHDGLPRLVIRRKADGVERTVAFGEEAYALTLNTTLEYDSPVLRFVYSSPATPEQTVDYDLETGARTVRKQQRVPSGHNPSDYVVRRLMAPAPDGELVPVTVLHRKGLRLDGTAALFLSGYGAYGSSQTADFDENARSLVDRGVVYATAHVRGGQEKGDRWYQSGRRKNKPNSFADFIAAAEFLIGAGYAAPNRVVARGESAGGLLVGAAVNVRPSLFAGVVARVPFVDALTTTLDDSLPLTAGEAEEWGDPITDPEAYRVIAAYSPYDNIRPQAYPPVLAFAGLTDPRVTYWEPAKWVAKLRATRTNDSRITLITRMSAGHFGASGRFENLDEVALIYAFVLECVGMTEVEPLAPSTAPQEGPR